MPVGAITRSDRGTIVSRTSRDLGVRLVWSPREMTRWALVVTAGAVLWIVAWYVASSKINYTQQLPFLDMAIAGLILALGADVTLLMAGRRSVGSRRRFLLGEPGGTGYAEEAPRTAEVYDLTRAPNSAALVGGPSLNRYHRADCPMAAGRDWAPASRWEHEEAGRSPCGLCKP